MINRAVLRKERPFVPEEEIKSIAGEGFSRQTGSDKADSPWPIWMGRDLIMGLIVGP